MLLVTLIFCSVYVFYFVVGCVADSFNKVSVPIKWHLEFAGIGTGFTMFFTLPFWGLYLMDQFGML